MFYNDPALNSALQASAPGLGTFMIFISFVEGPAFLLFVIPLVLWCWDKTLGARLIILYSLTFGLNALLELFFHSPRPYWVSKDVTAFGSETSFGMPSCHAQESATIFGYTGIYSKTRAVWVICIILIVLVAISRMYLGVHFLGDILTGWIAAIVLLAVVVRYGDAAATWFFRQTVSSRVLFALAASASVIVASQLVLMGLGTWQVPAAWSAMALAKTHVAINPVSLGDTLFGAGLLFGTIAGAGISAEYYAYRADGSRSQKAIRAVLGILILLAIMGALEAATKSPDLAGYGITWCRTALAGLWITAGAPYLFCRLGLMSRK